MIVCFTTCEYLFLILISVIHEYCKRISDIIVNLVAQFEWTQFRRLNHNLLIFKNECEKYEKVKGLITAEGNSMSEEVKAEDEEGYLGEDKREQAFVLLLRVTQANGKPLPICGFTNRVMAQMLYEIAGVTPKGCGHTNWPSSSNRIVNGNTNNGSAKSSALIVSMGWTIHNCR